MPPTRLKANKWSILLYIGSSCAVVKAPLFTMSLQSSDPIAHLELEVIRKIIHDETWLEAERRGQPVDQADPIVISQVCDVVMRIGAQLRASYSQSHPESSNRENGDDWMAA